MALGLQAVMIAMMLSDAVRSQSETGWKFPGSSSSNATSAALLNDTTSSNATNVQGRNININIMTNPSDGFVPFPNQGIGGKPPPQISISGFDPYPRPMNFGDPNGKFNPYGSLSAFNPSKNNFIPSSSNYKGFGAQSGNFNPFMTTGSLNPGTGPFKPGTVDLKPSGSGTSSFSGFAGGSNFGSGFNQGASGSFGGAPSQFGTGKFGGVGDGKFGSGFDGTSAGKFGGASGGLAVSGFPGSNTGKFGSGQTSAGTGKFAGSFPGSGSNIGANKFGPMPPNPGFIPPNFGDQCTCTAFYLCKAQDVVYAGPNLIDQRSANKNLSVAAVETNDESNSTESFIAAESNGTLFRSKREDELNETLTNTNETDISGRSFRPFPGSNILPGGFPSQPQPQPGFPQPQPGFPQPQPGFPQPLPPSPGRPVTNTPGCPPMQVCCRSSIIPPPPIPGPGIPRPGQPFLPKCGVRNLNGVVGRVKNLNFVEGETQFGEFPWQGAVLRKDGKERMYVCGATLITPSHVLTAAHCVHTLLPVHLKVRLGEWDVSSPAELYPYVELNVAEIRIHPHFYPGNLNNDIAVLKLDFPVDFNQFPQVAPVCLPPRFELFAGRRCIVTGWGKDAFGFEGQYQNILKQVQLPVLDNFDCQNRLRHTRLGPSFNLMPGFMCAGGEPGKDACKGDGGSPLVCETEHGYVVAGIVSWGIGCGHPNIPGVYVRVAEYLDWINSATAF